MRRTRRAGGVVCGPERILTSVGGHEASVGLHQAAGFEIVGAEREVGRKFGGWLDVVVMQRMLT